LSALQFPEKLDFLFSPARYKVAYGGRGSGKSWSFARALLILGCQRKLRILCTREVQNSIKDSVHKLLSDQIEGMGLGAHYQVLTTEIRGINGTEFLFAGLATQTAESLKSYEGVDIVWCEEAHKISRRSWTILIPTIRKESSEIWVSFNPELDDDETYTRFVVNPPPDAVVVRVNYHDNPWFPLVLERERQHAKATLPADEYANIWEGSCRSAIDGAIYAGEIQNAIETGRICPLPYEPKFRAHVVFDLGWNDSTAIMVVQRHLSEARVIDYIEDSHKTLDWYSSELRNRRYNWGTVFLPHDGDHKNLQTGLSAVQVMRDLGWEDVRVVDNVPLEVGIKTARQSFRQFYFDKDRTTRLVQCLKRYRRAINATTNEPGAPLHDEYSHASDCFRYTALALPQMTNAAMDAKPISYPKLNYA
jgi:phage terminase large subunit